LVSTVEGTEVWEDDGGLAFTGLDTEVLENDCVLESTEDTLWMITGTSIMHAPMNNHQPMESPLFGLGGGGGGTESKLLMQTPRIIV
jgi:hypothetical protein